MTFILGKHLLINLNSVTKLNVQIVVGLEVTANLQYITVSIEFNVRGSNIKGQFTKNVLTPNLQ